MAPPKKPAPPAVRGRPQIGTGNQRASAGPAPQAKNAHPISPETGKTPQRVLNTAPNAQGKARPEASAASKAIAAKALSAAAKIELHIPALPISKELVKARVEELRRLISMTRPRAFGTHIKAGDEVELDLLGYIEGQLFLAQHGVWFSIAPNPFLPGLLEQLIGVAPPDNVVIQLRIPQHYPVEAHRGKMAAFAITVRRAQERVIPSADDPNFLLLTHRHVKTRAELERALADELAEERGRLCVDEAKVSILRELYVQLGANDAVPDDLVEEELRRRWKVALGDSMAYLGVPVEDQKKSLADFCTPAMRAEARRVVWELRILDAVADAEGIEANEGEVHKMVEELAPNMRKGDVEQILYQHAQLSRELVRNLRQHRALVALLGKAKIAFDGKPRTPEQLLSPLPTAGSSGGPAGSGGVTTTRGLTRPPSKAPPR